MNRRMAMGGDTSLNVPMREDGEGQWQDWLSDEGPLQDERVADAQEAGVRHGMLVEAMADLNEREKHILAERRLRSEEHTSELQSLMRISYAVICLKTKKKHT